MSSPTPNMGLTAWVDLTDPFSHTILAGNFTIIDGHNHRDVGVQIPLGGLNNGAVDTNALADDSVSTVKIIDGAVTFDKLASSLLASMPLGAQIGFWRPNTSTSIPLTGMWVAAVGQVLNSSQHDFPGGGSITLPDLRQTFTYGGQSNGSDMGDTGGSNTANLGHHHDVNPHHHSIAPHLHAVESHAHFVSNHHHVISADGSHAHLFGGGHPLETRRNAFITQDSNGDPLVFRDTSGNDHTNTLQSTFVSGITTGSGAALEVDMDASSAHSHGGQTGDPTSTVFTTAATPNTSSLGLTTDDTSAVTADGLGGSTDIRPSFVTLVKLIKVKLKP